MKKSIAINKGLWYSIKRSCREGQANENFKKNQKIFANPLYKLKNVCYTVYKDI